MYTLISTDMTIVLLHQEQDGEISYRINGADNASIRIQEKKLNPRIIKQLKKITYFFAYYTANN